MIDIQYIRDNPEEVRTKSKQKGYDINVDQLLELDVKRRDLMTQIEELRRERNTIADSMKGGRPSDEQVAKGKEIKDKLTNLEHQFGSIDKEFIDLFKQVPNIVAADVPIGGEEDSVEIKRVGDQKTGARDHLDIANEKGWVDFERGAKVAGTKFYFLKGDLALLENAITQFALDFILKKEFNFMTVPHMVNTRTSAGAGFAPKSSRESNEYFIDGENMMLIGTAEAPLTGYHADEIIDE
ncbi:MAG: seryl-tRNA synthetase, partial [Patescibacteria group bacterium]|nr:seryl-tRNA synthetase [Patescibacteria group bacterium]